MFGSLGRAWLVVHHDTATATGNGEWEKGWECVCVLVGDSIYITFTPRLFTSSTFPLALFHSSFPTDFVLHTEYKVCTTGGREGKDEKDWRVCKLILFGPVTHTLTMKNATFLFHSKLQGKWESFAFSCMPNNRRLVLEKVSIIIVKVHRTSYRVTVRIDG